MLRVLLALLGILLLLLGAWVFLRSESVREVATAPGREVAGGEESDGRAELAAPPMGGSREAAEEAVAAESETLVEAAPAPLTGVLAGRLVIDGGPLPEATVITLKPDGALRERAEASVAIETDALGRFRREGLPADWSGVLWLSPPYRLAGDSEEQRLAVRLEAPSESLVIEVVRLPCLRGRLLHPRAESPAGTYVGLRLHSPAGGYLTTSATADATGRFLLVLGESDFTRIEVNATSTDGSKCNVAFDRTELHHDPTTGDYDLGELTLRPGLQVHVRVLDPDRMPVEEARVFLLGAPLRTRVLTDGDGEARFPVPDGATGMRMAASGFAYESFSLPTGTERVDVVLRRTNRLRVVVLDEHGVPWSGGRLRLRAEGELFASGESKLPGALRRGSQVFDAAGNVDERGPYSVLIAGDNGAVEVQDLSRGVPIDVEPIDALGRAWVAHRIEGLDPEEVREVELRLPPAGPRLRGRCRDPQGLPVADAQVWIELERASTAIVGEADGTFEGPVLAPGELWVHAAAPGHAKSER
ncbi:MAG TPA: carboxypeptidase-like regulatory domain-containing protein, partial [Planctomycetota bacterium]|nr:carboxypeptidase-like regulatory domain-containing protein [Planctomycetota bacterium]